MRDYKAPHKFKQLLLHMITKQALSSAEPIRDDWAFLLPGWAHYFQGR